MNMNSSSQGPPINLVPDLRQLVQAENLNPAKLTVPLLTDGSRIRVDDRHSVPLWDGSKRAAWKVPALRELFRGDRVPPDLTRYPDEYLMHFFFIESHLLTLCKGTTHPTDQEMEEIYSALRRRPDGRSLGPTHDYLWQVAALWLGRNLVSEPEYEAVFGKLLGSARTWGLRPISRNYTDYLQRTFGKA